MASSEKTKSSAELADKESSNEKPASRPVDLEIGEYAPRQGWLKEVWGKWPGNESIEELLAALKT